MTVTNPFTTPACKISGLKDARTRLETVYFQVLYLLAMLCILMNICTHASAKTKTKSISNFTPLLVSFK